MVHEGQGLALGLEPGHHLPRVHPRLEHLQRDLAAHGLRLFGQVDHAEPALPDRLQKLVRPDRGAGPLGRGGRIDGRARRGGGEKPAGPDVRPQEGVERCP
jgi:hypothetical protein